MPSAILKHIAPLLCALPLALAAQQSTSPAAPGASPPVPPGRDIPRPDQLEPAVDTTAAAPAPSAKVAPTPEAAASPSADTGHSAAVRKEGGSAKPVAKKAGADRLELDTTDITGNRELPKVLYIVPWKHSDLGDLTGKPVNSLLDDVLQPIDRDVFQRQNRYYDALKPDTAAPKAGAVQSSGNNP